MGGGVSLHPCMYTAVSEVLLALIALHASCAASYGCAACNFRCFGWFVSTASSPPDACVRVCPVCVQVMEMYQPEAIVVCSGADSLSGDKLGCFNLSLQGHSNCVEFLAK